MGGPERLTDLVSAPAICRRDVEAAPDRPPAASRADPRSPIEGAETVADQIPAMCDRGLWGVGGVGNTASSRTQTGDRSSLVVALPR